MTSRRTPNKKTRAESKTRHPRRSDNSRKSLQASAALVTLPALPRETLQHLFANTPVSKSKSIDGFELIDLKFRDQKDSKSSAPTPPKALSVDYPKLMLKSLFKRGYTYRGPFYLNALVQTNANAGRYLLQFIRLGGSAATSMFWSDCISNLAEWSSINAIFDEFFLHNVKVTWQPTNRYSGNSTANVGTATAAGQPGYVNTLAVAFAGYQHDQTGPGDNSAATSFMMTSSISKWGNTSDPLRFVWKNNEKFALDGPIGDASTTKNTQSWLNINNVANLGGYMCGAVQEPTGASASIGTLYEAALMYHGVLCFDISFRVRS